MQKIVLVVFCFFSHLCFSLEGVAMKEQIPQTMKSIYYTKYGDPVDVLKMNKEKPLPKCGSKEVLVEVYAAALNPADYKIIEGNFRITGNMIKRQPGFDFSGRVVKVGSDVKGEFEVGDVVHGMTPLQKTGTLSEYHAVKASCLAKKPEEMSFEEAAGLPLVGLTSSVIRP